jgi:hypothetical protein
VFSTQELAEAWISKNSLSGVLTLYRVDVAAYDFATTCGLFKPSKPHHYSSEFIGRFSGGDIHFHYETGVRNGTTRPPNQPSQDGWIAEG